MTQKSVTSSNQREWNLKTNILPTSHWTLTTNLLRNRTTTMHRKESITIWTLALLSRQFSQVISSMKSFKVFQFVRTSQNSSELLSICHLLLHPNNNNPNKSLQNNNSSHNSTNKKSQHKNPIRYFHENQVIHLSYQIPNNLRRSNIQINNRNNQEHLHKSNTQIIIITITITKLWSELHQCTRYHRIIINNHSYSNSINSDHRMLNYCINNLQNQLILSAKRSTLTSQALTWI